MTKIYSRRTKWSKKKLHSIHRTCISSFLPIFGAPVCGVGVEGKGGMGGTTEKVI